MASSQNEQGGVADYSMASPEEREQVIQILQRNLKAMLKMPQIQNKQALQERVERFIEKIRQGGRFTGKEFEQLVRIFRKRP
ncbi:MAG: hypothetical protein Q9P14_13990 [candidate division KSB1 bacterium]|nr:hypothetical protein [candidate division KSB1 bacterium]MDQ7066313.1 hypothetical protein [candidate division KSB1 bacterium]